MISAMFVPLVSVSTSLNQNVKAGAAFAKKIRVPVARSGPIRVTRYSLCAGPLTTYLFVTLTHTTFS